jgi:hypothetical protein
MHRELNDDAKRTEIPEEGAYLRCLLLFLVEARVAKPSLRR